MKKILFLLIFFPGILVAQKKTTKKKSAGSKTVIKASGYTITGNIRGIPDGTKIYLLNAQTGAQESESLSNQEKFSFSGTMPNPDFKLLQIAPSTTYVPLFLDNSPMKIVGQKDSLNRLIITGSPSHKDFELFNNSIAPYSSVFSNAQISDTLLVNKAKILCETFARKHPKSYIAPLAIIRYNQIAGEDNKIQELYNLLAPEIAATPMAKYLADQIAERNRNAIGSVVPDFTQEDTAGKPVSLSSFRGKYVLVDFWASWCRPCREENPNVVAAYNMFKNKNFTVLSVSLDKAKEAWLSAIKMDGLTWSHVSDLKGWSNSVAAQFGIYQIPQNILIDTQGRIIAKNLRGESLIQKLSRVIH